MKLTILLGLLSSLSISSSAVTSTYKVIKIHDGDTITVANTQDNSDKKVRLACIDAPESDQPQGKLSTITLKAFIPVGSEVELNEVDTDKYGRTVAEVLKNRININQSMLKKGQAIVYYKYLSNCPDGSAYVEAEKAAKNQRLGFWNDSSFISPEQWRNGSRSLAPKPQKTVSNPTSNSAGGYIAGSCSYLKSLGLSRFTPRDPNYTKRRDKDGDGVACE